MKTKRLTIHRKDSNRISNSFADDVRLGLSSSPKFLLPKYFYDELGSILFDAITLLPEYYPTRKEGEILNEHAIEIANSFEGEIVLIELGSGSSAKTRHLIDAIFSRQKDLTYIPIEISQTAIESSSETLLKNYPNLTIEAYVGDYVDVLKEITLDSSKSALVLFLGNSIGNVSIEESIELLQTIRRILSVGDALLLGTDLVKPLNILEPAYDDSLGITAAFNLNILNHINRELNADFDVRAFKHIALYNSDPGRIEMHLESRKEQTVFIQSLNQKVAFTAGERIHTENSYKYDSERLLNLALKTGFELKHSWYDSQSYFSNTLFAPKSPKEAS
jgi:L-histidine N-alpha-methyltransferase